MSRFAFSGTTYVHPSMADMCNPNAEVDHFDYYRMEEDHIVIKFRKATRAFREDPL